MQINMSRKVIIRGLIPMGVGFRSTFLTESWTNIVVNYGFNLC
jgi:hypothetical protein